MVHRRDVILGLTLLAVLLGLIFITFLLLKTVAMEGIPIKKACVGVVEINGPIINPMPVVERLERYIQDDNILAVVLRLNTPGGGVSATQEICETVKKTRQSGKSVIASMGAVAASGGYYIAAVCDTIVATPGTITGSIGVIAEFAEFSDLLEKIGIGINVRKSGKYKDIGSISREMTKEEEALIDGVIMDIYEQFVQEVSEGRNLDSDFVREYADGRIFTGKQALEIGFVDMLGTYQDAIDLAGNIAGLGINPPVYKETRNVFWEVFSGGVSKIMARLFELEIPRISYMWVN